MISYFKGEATKAVALAEKAIDLIPEKHFGFRADVFGWWTAAMQLTGQGEYAVKVAVEHVKNLELTRDSVEIARRTTHPNFVHITNADLPSLKKSKREFFNTPDISSYLLGWGWYFRACISWWSFEIEDALRNFKYLLTFKYKTRPRLAIEAYLCASFALQELNRPKEAILMLNEGIKYAEETKDRVNMSIIASGKARLDLLQDNLKEAEDWLGSIPDPILDTSMFWWVEVPAITRCKVLIAMDTKSSLKQVLELLTEYKEYSESIHNKLRTIEVLVLQTQVYLKLKLDTDAIKSLKFALDLAAKGKWVRPFAEMLNDIEELLMLLMKQNFQSGFIETILNEGNVNKENPKAKRTKKGKVIKKEGTILFFSQKEKWKFLSVYRMVCETRRSQKNCLTLKTRSKSMSIICSKNCMLGTG
jgi:tetratricopeptide (TPR) repeat protein